MEPTEAYSRLRVAIPRRPELRFQSWPKVNEFQLEYMDNKSPYHGACYIATQVFCHLVPEAKPFSTGRSHFWAQIGDEIWDPTADQFDYPFPYEEGRRTKFPHLTKRSAALLEEVLSI